MKKFLNQSFFRKLLCGFLITGIVPLFICTIFFTNVFKTTLVRESETTAQAQLENIAADMNELFDCCEKVITQISESRKVQAALSGESAYIQSVYGLLYEATRTLQSEASISVLDADGKEVYAAAGSLQPFYFSNNWGIIKAAQQGGIVYRDVEEFEGGDKAAAFQAACAIKNGDGLIGYVVVTVNSAALENMLSGEYGTANDIAVADSFWHCVYSTQPTLQADLLPSLRRNIFLNEAIPAESDDCYYYIAENEKSGFYIFMQQPKPLAQGTLKLLYGITGSMIAFCLGLCIIFSLGMSRQFFEPVRALNDAMIKVEKGNLEVIIENDRTDEMGQLAGRFNRMVKKLDEYIKESLHRQKQLNDTQIRMMQAQLNPHFLYNTLDTMKWIAKINHVEDVATMSADLANILRSSISDEEFVTLNYELDLLERYVEIQKIRFPNKFDFKIDVEDSVREVTVPKLMLQPLVENSIIHGFEDGSTGEITVSAYKVGSELILTVRDNGCGISREMIKALLSHSAPPKGHLGLYNVDAILRLHYGNGRGLRFIPVRTHGTCIRIVLPIA